MSTDKEYGLSLQSAIIININIMLGAGIFLNTVELSKLAGALSGFAYIIIGLIMLPLVISVAKLTGMHPDGGFYTFGKKELSPLAGFLAGWAYFIGKLGSGALIVHFSLTLIQQLIPVLGNINILVLDLATVSVFVFLNMQNIKSSSVIQAGFTILKIIPITFAILVGLYLFDSSNIASANRSWEGLPCALPLLFYAAMGFEAACILSCQIKNPSKNAPKAILISYAISLTIAAIYQFIFYGALGPTLAAQPDYLYTFPTLLKKLLPFSPSAAATLKNILHLALASSALGGSYGIMFSNVWNLNTLAKNKHILFANIFTKFNKHSIPFACVIVEGLIYITYILVSHGSQMHLQPMSSLGVVFAYTISVLALFVAKIKRKSIPTKLWIPLIGLGSCGILIFACVKSLFAKGFASLVTFTILLLIGYAMFLFTARKNSYDQSNQPQNNPEIKN